MEHPAWWFGALANDTADTVTSETLASGRDATMPPQPITQVEVLTVPSSPQHSQSLHGGPLAGAARAD